MMTAAPVLWKQLLKMRAGLTRWQHMLYEILMAWNLIILSVQPYGACDFNDGDCVQICSSDQLGDSSSLPVEHRGGSFALPLAPQASTNTKRQIPVPVGPSYPGQGVGGPIQDDAWPISSPNDQPKIKNLQVQCEKTHMRVNIEFDRPFYGMIFSKGHYSDPNCVHVRPGSGQLSATFDVYLNSCGMTSSANTVSNCLLFHLIFIWILSQPPTPHSHWLHSIAQVVDIINI